MAQQARAKKVIGIGMACLDQLIVWQDLRTPLAANRLLGHDVQGGGMAATALVTVARLGGKAEFWGAVGNDWIGDLILRGLRDEGVGTSQVRRVAGQRGPMMMVWIDQPTGERHFFRLTGFCRTPRPVGSLARLKSAGCLLVDQTRPESILRAAREARRLGVPVVGDLGSVGDEVRKVLRYVDYAIFSETAVGDLAAGGNYRRACQAIRAMGPPHVVITLGRRGLVFLEGGRFGRLSAFPVKVVDTTGAGDTVHGAFCYGLVEGLPLEKNLAFASAVAAMKCRRLGGRAGIPTRAEVVRFLKQRKIDVFAAGRRRSS